MTMYRLFRQQSARNDILRRYREIVTHSRHMQQEMDRHGFRARVVDFPITALTGNRPATLRECDWRMLFAGRMDTLKGGSVLIDAMPMVTATAGTPVHLDMVGDGPCRAAWEERAQAVKRRTPNLTIAFTGWLRQPFVRELMQKTSLLVVPSLWPEPFGSVGPLAGQHGVPAAAFDVGGISQWLADGTSGHLAPGDPPTAEGLAEAIVRCLGDPAHHARLREGARRMAAKFTLEAHLPQLVEVLSDERTVRAAAV